MLEILTCSPVAAPLKSGLRKQPVTQVITVNLIREILGTVTVFGSSGRLNVTRSVLTVLVIRIVQSVDINSQTACVLRECGAARYHAVAEARSIIVTHLRLIIRIIHIRQQHPLDRIPGIIQLTQDTNHTVGNLSIAYHLSDVNLLVVVPMQGTDVSQVGTSDVGILLIRLSLHTGPNPVRHRLGPKAFFHTAISLHSLGRYCLSCLPLSQGNTVNIIMGMSTRAHTHKEKNNVNYIRSHISNESSPRGGMDKGSGANHLLAVYDINAFGCVPTVCLDIT